MHKQIDLLVSSSFCPFCWPAQLTALQCELSLALFAALTHTYVSWGWFKLNDAIINKKPICSCMLSTRIYFSTDDIRLPALGICVLCECGSRSRYFEK